MSGELYCKGCFKKKFKARGRYDDITKIIPGSQKHLDPKRRLTMGNPPRPHENLLPERRIRSQTVSYSPKKAKGGVGNILARFEKKKPEGKTRKGYGTLKKFKFKDAPKCSICKKAVYQMERLDWDCMS